MRLNEAHAVALARGLTSREVNAILQQYRPKPFEMPTPADYERADAETVKALLAAVDVSEDTDPRQVVDAAYRAAQARGMTMVEQLRFASAQSKLGAL